MQAQAQGDYLRALHLLRGLADDRYPASYDVLAYVLQAVGRFAEAEQAVRRSFLLQQPTAQPIVAFDMDKADVAWMQEHPGDSGQYRERRMAEHIIERILQKEPAARVLIWVGYDHAYKYLPPSRLKMMAAWLWELAGEEPFSCYQQTGGLPQRWVDLVIRHPEPTYQNGRPQWLRTPDRCAIQGRIIPPASALVQLHLAQEGSAGTPVDQYLTGEDGAFELFAPQGAYLLRWWSPDGRVIGERLLTLRTEICQIDLPLT